MDREHSADNRNRFLLPLMAVLLVLLLILLFMIWSVLSGTMQIPVLEAEPTPTFTPAPTRVNLAEYYHFIETQQIPVYDHREGRLIVMDFETYIIGVVGAEMPVGYAPEALKAQAVAARTYALRKILRGGCQTYPEAAVCTNSSCCQAFISDSRMEERWKDAAGMNYNTIAEAVMSTVGEVLVYHGEIVDAMFHACSGGRTENSENVYANALPYLRGVESPYEDPMRTQDVEVSFEEAVEKINTAYPDAKVSMDNIRSAISLPEVFPSGRVKTVRLGEIEIVGKKLRPVFNLQSAMFTVETTDTGFIFHVKGYGHGVGMSQNGANGMAKHGSTYQEILKHYYTGVTIEGDLNHALPSDSPATTPEA